jgi:sulfite exporter TauE/SafE/plastocyanin domain-containing protein/copper chaperone CopZ
MPKSTKNMSNDKCLKVPIKGMHCRSCELLIEDKLAGIPNITKAEASHSSSQVVVCYEGDAPDKTLIEKAISEAGYEVGMSEKAPLYSKDKREYKSLGIAFLILAAIYLVLKASGLTSISIGTGLDSLSFGLILVVGLVAGFSTCMALVGGLSIGLSAKFLASHPTATASQKFKPHAFFTLGRITAYAILGGVLGLLGTAFQLSSTANGIITLAVGAVMLLMGLQLINIFPRLNDIKIALPKSIGKALGLNKKNNEYSNKNAMALGALTFFLPCGFTQAMQLYAIGTGSFWSGALIMGLFAIGTAPGLLSIGGITSLVRGAFKERFFKLAGLAVIFFGLFNISNGYVLSGFSPTDLFGNGSSDKIVSNDPNVTIENGVQIVRMTENNEGYSPNKFAIRKGVPVRWIIDAQAPYSCASAIIMPKLGIQENLKPGENIIEFTATETGRLPFSCSMGMYTGTFNVYEGDNSQDLSASQEASTPIKAKGGSCGASASTGASSCSGSAGGSCGSGAGGCGGSCGCGGGNKPKIDDNTEPVAASITDGNTEQGEIQIIKASYTKEKYLYPTSFKVKAGTKARFEIDVQADGRGCGDAIAIDTLFEDSKQLRAGTPIVMEFTPTTPGSYTITCGMGMIEFGTIIVE